MNERALVVDATLAPTSPHFNPVIGSPSAHNIDVISGSGMSQYGSNVACVIISNPLCCGSGLAGDLC